MHVYNYSQFTLFCFTVSADYTFLPHIIGLYPYLLSVLMLILVRSLKKTPTEWSDSW